MSKPLPWSSGPQGAKYAAELRAERARTDRQQYLYDINFRVQELARIATRAKREFDRYASVRRLKNDLQMIASLKTQLDALVAQEQPQ
jgi:hypothetical protein